MKQNLMKTVELGEGITASHQEGVLIIKGLKGELLRNFFHPRVKIATEANKIILRAEKATKREKTVMGSFYSHIKNMVTGVANPHIYKLKICSGHFPMSVSVSGQEFTVKNFLGETVPRKVTLPKNVEVKVSGSEITVTSSDIEAAGQAAAKIETACKIKNRDLRIFQDGCYITEKAGRHL